MENIKGYCVNCKYVVYTHECEGDYHCNECSGLIYDKYDIEEGVHEE